jgi:hypothetical protein
VADLGAGSAWCLRLIMSRDMLPGVKERAEELHRMRKT